MTKTTSIVLICVILAVVLFLGVFAFYPVEIEYGEYSKYYSPLTLVQKGNSITDSEIANYKVKLDEEADINNVVSILRARLSKAYGYYDAKVSVDNNVATIVIPQSSTVDKTSATSILNTVSQKGKVEILSNTTYSKENIVVGNSGFKRARVQTYGQDGNTFYICEVTLNQEGAKAVTGKLTSGSQYSLALDETVNTQQYMVIYTGSNLQVYSTSKENCEILASYINTDVLPATLTLDETDVVRSNGGMIFGIVFSALVLATFVYFIARYKVLGIAGIVSHLIAIVLFIIAAGLIHFEVFNIFAAVGVSLAYAFMTFFTIYTFEKIRALMQTKTFGSSRYTGFKSVDKLSLIAHAAFLVLGIILWVIPTVVTAPIGNAFVYGALLSCVSTLGLNRAFAIVVDPLVETK